LVLIDAKHILQ